MGKTTEIAWADSTFNPVIGCTKVGPGCDHCYAESYDKRTGGGHWGPGATRRVTSNANWRQPLKWNERAVITDKPRRVFCASLSDVFDNEWPEGVRERLWRLIKVTPALTWMLLTKRIGNAARMLPTDWGNGYPNVWLGATVVNQEEAERDIPKLLSVPARVRFLSVEPMLGPITLPRFCGCGCGKPYDTALREATNTPAAMNEYQAGALMRSTLGVDWVIVGGESGSKARPMNPQWARNIRDQCSAAGVAFFFKQWGNFIPACQPEARNFTYEDDRCEHVWDAASAVGYSIQVGKALAGRTLDGRTYDEFPRETR